MSLHVKTMDYLSLRRRWKAFRTKSQRIFSLSNEPKFTLISPMRNEGPYILEWLAWHRAVGFDEILVITNNCTDGSDLLLAELASEGFVTHIDHSPPEGTFALNAAFELAQSQPVVIGADWVMILDADEFLVVHGHDNTVQSLVHNFGTNCLGMAIHWKCFGDNDRQNWADGMVREAFTRCADGGDPANMRFKSLFREATKFTGFRSHAPFGFKGEWGGGNIWVDSSGTPLYPIQLVGDTVRRATKLARITHAKAQVNHYVTKSAESMSERRQKWRRANRDTRYDEDFLTLYNKNESEDNAAISNTTKFEAQYALLTKHPEIRRLHHSCCAAYAANLARLEGKDPEQDARFKKHLALSK